ncbi:unnamed protein product [Protopolystoma xenopodis]|uniref:Uncharacterized protein n=1 Tax=Protopolystoma xenopodis TaxID=117903 RepID=A0A448WWD3_9PLAT|nr:unnamed protein product [Protopolystoma xenopodis]
MSPIFLFVKGPQLLAPLAGDLCFADLRLAGELLPLPVAQMANAQPQGPHRGLSVSPGHLVFLKRLSGSQNAGDDIVWDEDPHEDEGNGESVISSDLDAGATEAVRRLVSEQDYLSGLLEVGCPAETCREGPESENIAPSFPSSLQSNLPPGRRIPNSLSSTSSFHPHAYISSSSHASVPSSQYSRLTRDSLEAMKITKFVHVSRPDLCPWSTDRQPLHLKAYNASSWQCYDADQVLGAVWGEVLCPLVFGKWTC